jgi:hypothetical protein
MDSALTGITFNFTFPNHRINRKAPATPQHKTGRSRSGCAPGQGEGERGQPGVNLGAWL